jgi:hypothetical protein
MNERRMITVIATLLMLVVPNHSPAYSRSDNDPTRSRWQRYLTPDEEFTPIRHYFEAAQAMSPTAVGNGTQP